MENADGRQGVSEPEPDTRGSSRGANPTKVSRMPGSDPASCCGQGFDLWGPSETIFCELDDGHRSSWHRNVRAGFEWSGRILWPLPRTHG